MRASMLAILVVLSGCEAGTVMRGTPDAETGAPDVAHDATAPLDVAPDASDAPTPSDATDVLASGARRTEICGNGYDDDGNGLIDDGCDCAVGTSRACWLGSPETRGVGACHDGVENCQSDGTHSSWALCAMQTLPTREILANGIDDDCDGVVDESDGICVPRTNSESGTDCTNGLDDDCDTLIDCADPSCAGSGRCSPACTAHETVCWGGVDEDCDGQIDCADSDCASSPSCATGPCPAGQTPTYRERDRTRTWGPSSIAAGDGLARMPMTCEPGGCGRGEVSVVLSGQMPMCVPPPPACTSGQYPTYIASGMWRCDPPCDLLVHYGSLYGGITVCAGRPTLSCPTGQSPTFVQSTETWMCMPTCNNSVYDQISLGGAIVCVPC